MLEIRLAELAARSAREDRSRLAHDIFGERFLLKRPLLLALEPGSRRAPPVLLIDEIDRTDEPFEAFLLEILTDFQVTIPELGTVRAPSPPIVVLTSNRTREIHDALKRRCLYHWIGYPDAARELEILRLRAPELSEALAGQIVALRPDACAQPTSSSCPASPRPSTGPAPSSPSTGSPWTPGP